MENKNRILSGCLLVIVIGLGIPKPAQAQNEIGGHFGMVLPLMSLTDRNFSSIADNFQAGFPIGITVKPEGGVAFDLEVVPFLDEHSVSNILLHPGLLVGLTDGYTFGLRGAFETGGAYGATALLNKAFPLPENPGTVFFVELVLPLRLYQESPAFRGASELVSKTIAVAVHAGVGF